MLSTILNYEAIELHIELSLRDNEWYKIETIMLEDSWIDIKSIVLGNPELVKAIELHIESNLIGGYKESFGED